MTNGGKKLVVAEGFKSLAPQKNLAGGISSGFSRIGIKNKVFTLYHQKQAYRFIREDDNSVLPYIDVVVLDANPNRSKLYYPPGTYTEDANNAPTCASINGITPDPGVPVPQNKTCNGCRRDNWITLPTGGRGKECQDNKRLAVLMLPYMKTIPAMNTPLLEPVYFKVTPASLTAWKTYFDGLQHQGVHTASVITRISFDPVKNWVMVFETKQALSDDNVPMIKEMLEHPQIRVILGSTSEIQGEGEPAPPPLPTEDAQLQALAKPRQVTKIVEQAPKEDPPPWEASNDDMDEGVLKLLSQKTSDMLK